MSIPTRCPACRTTFDAPDVDEGQRVACPKCRSQVNVPNLGGFAVVDDEPPTTPPRRTAKPISARVVAPPPTGSKATKALAPPIDEVDEVEEDEDDRPRRRSRKPAKRGGGALKWVLACLGGFALACLAACGVGAYLMGAFDPSPPAGYQTIRSSKGGYRVWLPAPAGEAKILGDNLNDHVMHTDRYVVLLNKGWTRVVVESKKRPGVPPDLSLDGLTETFFAVHPYYKEFRGNVMKLTTLGGQPAVEFSWHAAPRNRSAPSAGRPTRAQADAGRAGVCRRDTQSAGSGGTLRPEAPGRGDRQSSLARRPVHS